MVVCLFITFRRGKTLRVSAWMKAHVPFALFCQMEWCFEIEVDDYNNPTEFLSLKSLCKADFQDKNIRLTI